ncbi:BrnT family toxin [[Limnothrix rosea] IAM M-220]|uniref:BrnT family toxin n=1 Tax=[Limnothrix rosea] IAM M-220 TaxID=454133 RepID=UPI001F32B8A1|nr:BrnT family toxin [[Limnothrix rosea] IAM M-220]
MEFEWDEEKAKTNLSKHGVSFAEAQTVFTDPFYIDFFDPDYSTAENRFIIIGQSLEQRLLFVSYTEGNNKI